MGMGSRDQLVLSRFKESKEVGMATADQRVEVAMMEAMGAAKGEAMVVACVLGLDQCCCR